MDVFLEYMVKRKNTTKAKIRKILIIIGMVLACFLITGFLLQFPEFGFALICAIAVVIYVGVRLLADIRTEYEYIVTNGEMDVDKITSRRKRKRLLTVKFNEMDIMAPMGGEHKNEYESKSGKDIDASISPDEKGNYFIILRTTKSGLVRLIFSPNEKIIKSAKSFAPRKVFTL